MFVWIYQIPFWSAANNQTTKVNRFFKCLWISICLIIYFHRFLFTVPTFDLYIVEFDTFYELSRHTFKLLASKSSLDYIGIHIFFFVPINRQTCNGLVNKGVPKTMISAIQRTHWFFTWIHVYCHQATQWSNHAKLSI